MCIRDSVWWVTAIGQEKAQKAMKPLLGIPDELSVLDIMCFGPPSKPPYKRWKKELGEITNWNKFDRTHFMTDAQIDEWVATCLLYTSDAADDLTRVDIGG